MIRLFGQTDKVFLSNGDLVLSPLKAKVYKRDNGDYYLDLETGLEYVDALTQGRIVVAPTPTGDQAFRITNVQKTRNKVTCRCPHVFYDSKNYLIQDSYVVDKNCANALSHLNGATEPVTEFQTSSDVQTVNSFRCVRKSLYEAVYTVLERWGGHLVRDNFTISILSSVGQDNGVTVQYKKNLKEITCQENWDLVVTKLLPVGKDGILLNALDPSASVYLESDIQYVLPFTKTVSFNQDINEQDYETEAEYKQALIDDLRAKGQAYLDENCVPKVNYNLKANIEKLSDIGDTIRVYDERIGVDLLTRVIAFQYDAIFGKYMEVEFGNFTYSLSGFANKVDESIFKTSQGILGNKQLTFQSDGTVKWIEAE